jgi:hypothetical protein
VAQGDGGELCVLVTNHGQRVYYWFYGRGGPWRCRGGRMIDSSDASLLLAHPSIIDAGLLETQGRSGKLWPRKALLWQKNQVGLINREGLGLARGLWVAVGERVRLRRAVSCSRVGDRRRFRGPDRFGGRDRIARRCSAGSLLGRGEPAAVCVPSPSIQTAWISVQGEGRLYGTCWSTRRFAGRNHGAAIVGATLERGKTRPQYAGCDSKVGLGASRDAQFEGR